MQMSLLEKMGVPMAAEPVVRQSAQTPRREKSDEDILLTLLQRNPDTIDHLFQIAGWDREVTQRVLLRLVVKGEVKCTCQHNTRWYSVRSNQLGQP